MGKIVKLYELEVNSIKFELIQVFFFESSMGSSQAILTHLYLAKKKRILEIWLINIMLRLVKHPNPLISLESFHHIFHIFAY